MGIGDWIKDKVTPDFVKNVNKSLTPPATPTSPPSTPSPSVETTPQQKAYEAREKYMNRKNPYYKNVDNSGLTKEKL